MSRGKLFVYFYTRSLLGITRNPVKKITKAMFGAMMALFCFGLIKAPAR